MSDTYFDQQDEADRQDDFALAQEEAARSRLLTPPDESQGVIYGYGLGTSTPAPEQAIPTAPPPQQQQAPAPQFASQQPVGDQVYGASLQPQQPAGPVDFQGRPIAPMPTPAQPRLNRQERAAQDYESRFGTIMPDVQTYGVSADLTPKPTGGLATVVGLDFSTIGHQMASFASIGLRQLGASTEYLDHFNAEWQKFNDELKASLSPERQAAAGVSIFDPKKLLEVAKENPGAVLESYLVTAATAVASGLGAGAAAKLATRTALRIAGVAGDAAETATAAAQATAARAARVEGAAGIAGAGVQGGAWGAGARYEDYVHTLHNMKPEEKAGSAMYQGFKAQGLDDAAILKQMELQFPTVQQFGANLLVSTGLAAVTPGLRGTLGQRPTRMGNAAVGAAEAGGAGAAGTGYSSYTQQSSNVAAGAQPAINWGQVGAETALGGAVGGAFGGTTGAFRPGRSPEAPPPAGPPRVDTVTPGGVPPEHTAALKAAGIGGGPGGTPLPPEPTRIVPPSQPNQGPPNRAAGGAGIGGAALAPEPALALPRRGAQVAIGADESFFAPAPPRYDQPTDAYFPTGNYPAHQPPPETTLGAPQGPPARMAGAGVGGAPLAPEPTLARPLAREQPAGPGGVPLRPEPGLAQAIPTRPVAPVAGPGGTPLPAESIRGGATPAELAIQRRTTEIQERQARQQAIASEIEQIERQSTRRTDELARTRTPGMVQRLRAERDALLARRDALAEEYEALSRAPQQRGPLPPDTGPGGTPLRPEPYPPTPTRPPSPPGAGPGGTPLPAEGTPAATPRAAAVGPGGAPLRPEPTPAPAPPRPTTPPGPGGARLPAEPVRRAPQREQGPGESPGGTPLPEEQQRAAAPRQITEAVQGEGFTTQPGRAVSRASEGLSAAQLDERLAEHGLSQAQRNRLIGREKKAAALDKLEQEAQARGEEPAPAPRGAESREPAPTARPSEGMSHKQLGEALEKLGLSKREVNQLTNKVQRAAEYDRIMRSEEASLERLRNKSSEERKGENVSEEVPPREQTANKPTEKIAPGGFRTAKGSTYEVHEDGTTSRNKAYRPEHGEADQGPKARSDKTIYVNSQAEAANLSGAGVSGAGRDGHRLVLKDGKATLAWRNKQTGDWGTAPSNRDIPYTTEPGIGKSPVEMWGRTNDVPASFGEAYRGQHGGNAIVELTRTTAAKAEAVKERAKAQRTKREAAATVRAEEVAATPEDTPPAPPAEPPPGQASRQQRDLPTAASPLRRVLADDRVNAPVREALSRQPEGGSIHAPLRALANNPWINRRMPHVAALARQLQRMLPENLQIRHTDDPALQGSYVYGGTEAPHIYVSRNADATAVLHEAYHAVTARFIDQLPPGSREGRVLEAIRNELRQHLDPNDPLFAYALSDNHELHTIAKTSPELREAMSAARPSAEYRARMAELGYPVGPAKSLWQSLVRFTRKMLGLPQNATSLLDHIMRPLDEITAAAHRFNETNLAARSEGPRTQRDLPSFSQVRDWVNDRREGRAGNVSSGFRRAVRQVMPTEQLTGFNRHLFNSSQPGVGNLADNLARAAEGVERVSREYAEAKVGPDWLPNPNGKPREQAFREQNDKIDATTGLALTKSSRIDTHPAYPPDHPLNSHSRATPEQFAELQTDYRNLTPAQKQVFNDTFAMQRQLRVDEGDAAMRGIGKTYLEGVNDAQVETMVQQMRSMKGVNELLANVDTNPVARAFGDQWVGNRDFVRAIATEWKRGWINNYVPLHHSGDWVVNFTDPQTGEKGMISRYTMREAETARLQLEVDGAEPSLVLSRERRTPSDIPRLTIVDQFEAKLQRNPTLNADQVTAARDLLTKVLLDQSRFAGRNRERLGVHGADPTKLKEAMAQRFQALKNSVGHLEYGPQFEAGLNAMKRHVQEMGRGSGTVRIPDGSTGGRAAGNADAIQAQQYMEEMRRRKPISEDANTLLTKTAHNATMLTYFKFLASPAQTIMNGIDTYIQGIPRIGAQFGIGRATAALARASAEIMPRQFARGVAGTGAAARGRLDPGEWNSAMQIRDHLIAGSRRNDAAGMTALFQRMQEGNLIGYSSYRDLQAMAKGGNGWIRQKADMAADMVSILHNKMEDANRATVALAAYDVHFRKNGDRAAAIDYAEKTLRTAMPNFGLSNKPRFATAQGGFGVWGIPVAQFRQHGMWAYSQMALDFRNAFKGADKATKTEARYALAFTIGMQTVLFGALNWLADPLRYLWGAYDWISGGRPQDHSHDFRRYAEKLFGVTGGQFVSRGALGAAGYGPYTVERMGMINAALVPKMEGDWKNPKDVTYAAMTAVAGVPALGAATEIITGMSNFAAGNYTQAAKDLLPKILRDPIRAYEGETEGQISRRGNVLQTPEQISTLDTVYQTLGFKSARQGERSEGTGSQRELIALAAASRQVATRDAAHAMINGSASERRAADQAVKAHNKAYPGSHIDPKDVFAYRKREVERLRDPSLTGITVPKAMRPYVREAGAFANY